MSRPKFACLVAFLAFVPGTAFAAEKMCTIDFQRAVTDTAEGKAAQSKIDNMYATRKGELERMQVELQKAVEDYQKRAAILSNEARGAEEQKLALQQRTFEQTYMQFQDEMQQTYTSMLGELDNKMREIATAVGKESACSILLDTAVVVYSGPEVFDVTGMLVTRYNTTHPPK
jgi:outer membrane protein